MHKHYPLLSPSAHVPQHLVQLADVLVDFFGRYCGVVIYDLRDEQCPERYRIGPVSRTGYDQWRTAGSLSRVLKVAPASAQHEPPPVDPEQPLKSRTVKTTSILVKDENEQPAFAFCLQFDATDLFNACQAIEPFLAHQQQRQTDNEKVPTALSAEKSIADLFDQAVATIGKHPTTMRSEERRKLVALLKDSGVLQFKGAVERIAGLLGVSKYTVYNYLKNINNLETNQPITTRR